MTIVSTPRRRSPFQTSLSSLTPDVRQSLVVLSGMAVVALTMTLTTIPFGRAIWDFVILLDGAYRISLGQVPHLDFASPIGSLSLYLVFASDHLFPRANPFVGMHALAWLMMLPIVAALAPRFRNDLAFTAALALLALMVLVPVTVDSTHLSEISYFAVYNRFASGLLFLLGLWYVLPKSRYDGWLLAYLLLVLIFLKITAAIVAIGVVVAALLLGRARLRVVLTALVASAVVLALLNVFSGIVGAYVSDVRSMSATNQGRALYALFFSAFRNWSVLAAAGGIVVLALLSFRETANATGRQPVKALRSFLEREAFAIDTALLVAAALLAESQNTGGIGLIAAAAIVFHPRAWQGGHARTAAAILLLATLTLPLIDLVIKRSLTEFVRNREAASDQSVNALLPGTRISRPTAEGARFFERITGEWLGFARDVQQAGFFIDPDPTSNATAARLAWARSAVEAGQAFNANGYRTTSSRYATVAFSDPFARMLRLTPARGTTIAIEVGRSLPRLTEQGAQHYLADADGVFVDRCEISPSIVNEAGFQIVLDREFEKLPLHRCWDFYRRLPASQQRRGL